MAIYTVHLPPDAITPENVAENAVFVKEGFAAFGFVFTGFWLLSRRLWLYALGYGVVFGLSFVAAQWLGFPRLGSTGVMVLLALLIGIEGHEWVRRRYARLGWTHAGTVSGPSLDECERRFFKDWLAGRAVQAASRSAAPAPIAGAPAPSAVLGVFPQPRGQAGVQA
jgi:Protein of unknown function (DUF2628)